jgi:starvation-inducible DNA-binding protein
MMKLHKTSNALDSNVKATSIGLLNARVADTIDLALATKQAHWNIKGPNFMSVHLMLDTLRDEVDEYVDTMAERAVQLGGTALGTVQTTAKTSSLPPYPTDISSIDDHLRAMVERASHAASSVRTSIDAADEAGDADTADVFTEVSRGLDKWVWFLESHIVK